MNSRPYSWIVLALGGAILVGLGLYFVFLRPSLLPEDPRYMGTSLSEIQSAVPGLGIWLKQVFRVMGGYMFSAGLLTLYMAILPFGRALGVLRLSWPWLGGPPLGG